MTELPFTSIHSIHWIQSRCSFQSITITAAEGTLLLVVQDLALDVERPAV